MVYIMKSTCRIYGWFSLSSQLFFVYVYVFYRNERQVLPRPMDGPVLILAYFCMCLLEPSSGAVAASSPANALISESRPPQDHKPSVVVDVQIHAYNGMFNKHMCLAAGVWLFT